jgi:hypothetical protein
MRFCPRGKRGGKIYFSAKKALLFSGRGVEILQAGRARPLPLGRYIGSSRPSLFL